MLDTNKIKDYSKDWEVATENEYNSASSNMSATEKSKYLRTSRSDGLERKEVAFIPDDDQLNTALLLKENKTLDILLKEVQSIKKMVKFFVVLTIIGMIAAFILGLKIVG